MMDKTHMKKVIAHDYQRRIEKYKADHDYYPIIMAGDSMIAFYHLKKHLKDYKIMNQGIPGDTTIGLLGRLKYITQREPGKIFIHIGSNDLVLTNLTIDEIVENISLVKYRLKEEMPNSIVYIINLSPVLPASDKSNESYIFGRTNDQIKQINEQLSRVIPRDKLIDCYQALADEHGNLAYELTSDGIHLNESGYVIYSSLIKEKL